MKFRIALALLLAAALPGFATGTSGSMIGAGARMAWAQVPMGEPASRLEAQAIVHPLPKLFLSGAWSWNAERLSGGTGDTTVSELRWELGGGLVLLDLGTLIYVPVDWRHVRQRHDQWGDASWSEWAAGVGTLVPVRAPFWLRADGLWVMSGTHDDLRETGSGRIRTRGLELQLGFLLFLR